MSRNPMNCVAEDLRAEAVRFDACHKALREWTSDPDGLCELYIRHLDFCMDNDYPSNDYMKTHFEGVRQRHGIYVDDTVDSRGQRQVVCNGTSSGHIRYDGYGVGTVYARHDSDLEVEVADYAIVVIRVYDRARVSVINTGEGRVSVLRYGGQISARGPVEVSDLRESRF